MISNSYVINFGTDKESGWTVVNDGVMGGLSEGAVKYESDCLIFSGNLSLENNGGFSSLRSPLGSYDLSAYNKVQIRCKGSGGTFGFRLKNEDEFYLPYYQVEITPTENWETYSFNLSDFSKMRLGKSMPGEIDQKVLKKIIRLGFIKSDKREGNFEFQVDKIEFK